jgi:hypothetical protein
MSDAPVKIRMTTRAEADALVEQLARVIAQIAEFEAGRSSAVLAALRKRRDELTLELSRIKRHPNEA